MMFASGVTNCANSDKASGTIALRLEFGRSQNSGCREMSCPISNACCCGKTLTIGKKRISR
jgi:hypothetical protein